MALKESGEMYLETIYVLHRKQSNVRSVDIAEYRGFSKPSVSRGIGILKKRGYITVDENGYILLTETGREVSEKIFERHVVLTELLESMGVNSETAEADACRIEHVISEETFEAVKKELYKKKN